jgi:hypothetical protein
MMQFVEQNHVFGIAQIQGRQDVIGAPTEDGGPAR